MGRQGRLRHGVALQRGADRRPEREQSGRLRQKIEGGDFIFLTRVRRRFCVAFLFLLLFAAAAAAAPA